METKKDKHTEAQLVYHMPSHKYATFCVCKFELSSRPDKLFWGRRSHADELLSLKNPAMCQSIEGWTTSFRDWHQWWRQSGLHKLWYPSIRDTSTWSNFGSHGEHGDVFLFSNFGALWFSENLIRYSLHVCLREVKNNLFSFKHSYLRHFSWRF